MRHDDTRYDCALTRWLPLDCFRAIVPHGEIDAITLTDLLARRLMKIDATGAEGLTLELTSEGLDARDLAIPRALAAARMAHAENTVPF